MHRYAIILLLISPLVTGKETIAQSFYFGADQSYVNEMEDCGAVYRENGEIKDVHQIFSDHGCNLVRLRLWHTPTWYDQLNHGKRYSDLADVKKSIARVKALGMSILLDFHLSDNWADPSKQLVPAAWLNVVDDASTLKDSLYSYIYSTLQSLADDDLLPELVQIGNETNRGILLSPEDNEKWTLDWDRNILLFNGAIKAVRDFTESTDQEIKIVLHFAGQEDTEWYVDQFVERGVSDFDFIGISYYWAWHKPTTIPEAGSVIKKLREKYPHKEVIIVETGYLWTTENNDNAGNIINEIHPDYAPPSPDNQKKWLIDLTQTVVDQGGMGVIYWEPSWVSTDCWNQWNQGSHQEHATFFDFENDLLVPGGIEWMEHDYGIVTPVYEQSVDFNVNVLYSRQNLEATVDVLDSAGRDFLNLTVSDSTGRVLISKVIENKITVINMLQYPSSIYFFTITGGKGRDTIRVEHIRP